VNFTRKGAMRFFVLGGLFYFISNGFLAIWYLQNTDHVFHLNSIAETMLDCQLAVTLERESANTKVKFCNSALKAKLNYKVVEIDSLLKQSLTSLTIELDDFQTARSIELINMKQQNINEQIKLIGRHVDTKKVRFGRAKNIIENVMLSIHGILLLAGIFLLFQKSKDKKNQPQADHFDEKIFHHLMHGEFSHLQDLFRNIRTEYHDHYALDHDLISTILFQLLQFDNELAGLCQQRLRIDMELQNQKDFLRVNQKIELVSRDLDMKKLVANSQQLKLVEALTVDYNGIFKTDSPQKHELILEVVVPNN
jgi:hypothetical protein